MKKTKHKIKTGPQKPKPTARGQCTNCHRETEVPNSDWRHAARAAGAACGWTMQRVFPSRGKRLNGEGQLVEMKKWRKKK